MYVSSFMFRYLEAERPPSRACVLARRVQGIVRSCSDTDAEVNGDEDSALNWKPTRSSAR